ncbi:sugar phosphate isomerase/epimerase family protein [Thermodesulfobacteriota bacterium]
MGLKLGTALYTYLWDYPLEEAVKRISSMGIKYVELMNTVPHAWARGMDKKARKKMRELFESHGLEILALNPTFLDVNIASTNPGFYRESIRQLQETVVLCHDLGAKIAVVVAGQRHPLIAPSFEHFWNIVKDAICEVLETCEKYNIIFGLENGWTVIDKARLLKQMVDEVKHDQLKIVFDAANAHMVGQVAPGIELVKDHLVHFHLSDCAPPAWSHDPVGMGTVDFETIAETLERINFKGVSILETTYPKDPDGGIIQSIEKLKAWGWQI